MNYLIDTNVFFNILKFIAGDIAVQQQFDLEKIRKENCYISDITRIEIISVIGQYARGVNGGWVPCDRQIKSTLDQNEIILCTKQYFIKGRKKWSIKRTRDVLKLVSDIFDGICSQWKVNVLSINENVLKAASIFIQKALKFKFGSLDAIIAGTSISYNKLNLSIVTYDKSFRAALNDSNLNFLE